MNARRKYRAPTGWRPRPSVYFCHFLNPALLFLWPSCVKTGNTFCPLTENTSGQAKKRTNLKENVSFFFIIIVGWLISRKRKIFFIDTDSLIDDDMIKIGNEKKYELNEGRGIIAIWKSPFFFSRHYWLSVD